MATFNPVGASAPSAVTISAKSTPTIRSITLSATPGTESTLTFASSIVAFQIKTPSGDRARLSVATTIAGTATDDRLDIPMGRVWTQEFLTTTASKVFYISSNKASTVVQILEWT